MDLIKCVLWVCMGDGVCVNKTWISYGLGVCIGLKRLGTGSLDWIPVRAKMVCFVDRL